MNPNELALQLGISPKKLRDWLRATFPRPQSEHGTSWFLKNAQIAAAHDHFGSRSPSKVMPARSISSASVRGITRSLDPASQLNSMGMNKVDWQWCQMHARLLLTSGLQYLIEQPVKRQDELENIPGVYLISDAYDRCVYIGQALDVRKRVQSHSKPDSKISKHFAGVRQLKVTFGRLELEEFAITSLQPRLNSSRRNRKASLPGDDRRMSSPTWLICQKHAFGIIDQGMKHALDVPGQPWNNKTTTTRSGVYILRDSDYDTCYVGETHNIAERLRSHQNDTYFSALRRNTGRSFLGLHFAVGSRRRFSPGDDERVDSYLATCSLATVPVSIGRGELESHLISYLNPLLNRRR